MAGLGALTHRQWSNAMPSRLIAGRAAARFYRFLPIRAVVSAILRNLPTTSGMHTNAFKLRRAISRDFRGKSYWRQCTALKQTLYNMGVSQSPALPWATRSTSRAITDGTLDTVDVDDVSCSLEELSLKAGDRIEVRCRRTRHSSDSCPGNKRQLPFNSLFFPCRRSNGSWNRRTVARPSTRCA